ncbi:Phosphoinositide phospholipase C [Quillaja saponaria]|uniref:Phosphoinositide phospholipase C n=1 Tax=Quillaja saponaria TaxID=32244 RepID=A0AAD7LTU0_QUISA|nr:Phosphoinositide phospholipase C [Quillaja saponaria]
MSKQYFRICFCFWRKFKIKWEAEPPGDIKKLFDQYAEHGTMTIDHLLRFLIDFQGQHDATKDDAQAIFNSLKHLNIFQRKGLQIDTFFRYLLGDLNGPLSPRGVHHDMNAPLAHYFIYTGHNSYLTGNQLSSDSSTVPIIDALNKGVRVIELDLWPTTSGDDVEVRHGGTLTSPVELIECLEAIKNHAFSASESPVIITFEDHIPAYLQAKVAKLVRKTFGSMLFWPTTEVLKEFPSPASLKKRIMISTKPPENPEDHIDSDEEGIGATDKLHDTYFNGRMRQVIKMKDEEEIPEYRRLIAIHAGKPKGGIEKWLINRSKARRLSLSEQELEDIAGTRGTDIVRYTQRNLLRIYPKGMRLDSSNYNPMVGWKHGAQMVAFNMQGLGKNLKIMEGMFRANGGCGYVKKPEFLLTVGPNGEVFDPKATLPVKKTLKVRVYMGEGWHMEFHETHFDSYSPPDFFTKVGIAGVPADTVMKRTRAIEDQWVPVWNEEFIFPLTVPELALLRVIVLEYDTPGQPDFGGQTCLPISELRTGIRAVPLYNNQGEIYKFVRLLMRFEFV